MSPNLPPRLEGLKAVHTVDRRSARARGYTRRWEAARKRFLVKYPLCGMRPGERPPVMSKCHDEGRLEAGKQVDHVVPHRGNDALFWDEENNWQTLCATCGARKSGVGL